MYKGVWAFLFALAAIAPIAAAADETTFGVELTGTHGTHRESQGAVSAPLIPAPVVGISHRFKRFEVSAEGLPPIGTIPVSNNGLGMQNITLTYGDATLRYWNKRGTFAVGAGETLYNQRTKFLLYQDSFMRNVDTNYSRIVGSRYEVLGRMMLAGSNYVEAQFAVNPALHGRYSFEYRETLLTHGRSWGFTSPVEWERGSQVDANVRFVHAFGPYALSYGVRYLNYTARFTTRPWHPFADANSFVMPYVAVQRTWGR